MNIYSNSSSLARGFLLQNFPHETLLEGEGIGTRSVSTPHSSRLMHVGNTVRVGNGIGPLAACMGLILQKQGDAWQGTPLRSSSACLPTLEASHLLSASLYPSDARLPATFPPLILIFLLNSQFFHLPLDFPLYFSTKLNLLS